MTLLRTALIWDINLTYQARVPKSEPTDNAQPNGPRLSCGAKAGGRKHPALRYELVGAQTHISSERRPRQLQALVRPLHGLREELIACRDTSDRRHLACALCTTPRAYWPGVVA